MLDLLQEQALIRGYDVIICPSPLLPEFSEHIIIPELSLAFISQTVKSRYPYDIARHIRLDDIPENLILKTNRSKIKKQQKIYDSLITEALSILNEAGHMHDELESIYNPFVDFNGVISLAHEYTDKLQKAL